MAPAYLFQAPAGVPGDVTRPDETNVEPALLGSAASAYGIPVKYDSDGNIVPFSGGAETSASFAGVLSRAVPSISGTLNEGLTDNVPNIEQIQGMVVRGYVSVKCTVGTPVRGGIVYARIVAGSGKAVGDWEAVFDSGNNIAITNLEWASNGKDADNNAEIRVWR